MKTLAILAGVINFKKQFSHIHLSKMANLTFRAITLHKESLRTVGTANFRDGF